MSNMPGNLKLVLEHLDAVRELDRYLRRGGLGKDVNRHIQESLASALKEKLPATGDWECDFGEGDVDLYPRAWKLGDDLHVAINIFSKCHRPARQRPVSELVGAD